MTAAKIFRLGIHTGRDLRSQSLAFLAEHFGKAADYYYGVARGQDDRLVEADRVRKSVGAENTFATDLTRWEEIGPALEPVFAKVWAAYGRGGHAGRKVTVKVKYADFRQVTRSRSGADAVRSREELERASLDLLRPCFPPPRGIRLLGVTISNFAAGEPGDRPQLALTLGTATDELSAGWMAKQVTQADRVTLDLLDLAIGTVTVRSVSRPNASSSPCKGR